MQTQTKRQPLFWRAQCKEKAKFELSVDESIVCNGMPSCFFSHEGAEPHHRGYLLQTMGAFEYRGCRLRFSGKVKIKDLDGKVALFMKILDSVPEVILEDLMSQRELTQSGDWTQLDIVMDVPSEARYINFGLFIQGSGNVWVGDLSINEVGKDVALTEIGSSNTIYKGPTNFELTSIDSETNLPFAWRFHSGDLERFERAVKSEDGRQSLYIGSDAVLLPALGEKSSISGQFTQKFSCVQWRDKKVCFSADIKCKNVGDWAGLMMWVTGVHGKILRFTTMYDLAVGGDCDWQTFSVVLDVPTVGCNVIVGATLNGNGEVFFSNLSFSIADPDKQTTDRKSGPKNLTFAD